MLLLALDQPTQLVWDTWDRTGAPVQGIPGDMGTRVEGWGWGWGEEVLRGGICWNMM